MEHQTRQPDKKRKDERDEQKPQVENSSGQVSCFCNLASFQMTPEEAILHFGERMEFQNKLARHISDQQVQLISISERK